MYIIHIYTHVYIYVGALLVLLPAAVPWRDRWNDIHIRSTFGAYQCAFFFFVVVWAVFGCTWILLGSFGYRFGSLTLMWDRFVKYMDAYGPISGPFGSIVNLFWTNVCSFWDHSISMGHFVGISWVCSEYWMCQVSPTGHCSVHSEP